MKFVDESPDDDHHLDLFTEIDRNHEKIMLADGKKIKAIFYLDLMQQVFFRELEFLVPFSHLLQALRIFLILSVIIYIQLKIRLTI